MLRILLLLSCLTAVAYSSSEGSRWIGRLLNEHGMFLKLKDLTLPGTHHSGLVEGLSPYETYTLSVVPIALAGPVGGLTVPSVNSIIRASGITQTLTPTQQFESGVRKFDLRLSSWGDEFRLAHGNNADWYLPGIHPSVNGMKWKDFLQDSVNFLKANPSEFFIFSLAWENGVEKFEELADTLKHPCVKPLLYIHSGSILDIMSTPVCHLQGKILIRTQGNTTMHDELVAAGIPSHFHNDIWIGSWGTREITINGEKIDYATATSKPSEIFNKLIEFTDNIIYNQNRLYSMGATCTPDSIENINVKKLDKSCKPGIKRYISNTKAQKANVIDVDFAVPILVEKIYRLNMNKNIQRSGTCSVRNSDSSNQKSCSVKETCFCVYAGTYEDVCSVKSEPCIENSECKCTKQFEYRKPNREFGDLTGTTDISCKGALVYNQNAKTCIEKETCDCQLAGRKGCVVTRAPNYGKCECSEYEKYIPPPRKGDFATVEKYCEGTVKPL